MCERMCGEFNTVRSCYAGNRILDLCFVIILFKFGSSVLCDRY